MVGRAEREFERGRLKEGIGLGIPEQARWHLDAALARAATPTERTYVQGLLRADRSRKGGRARLKQPFWLLNRGRDASG